MPKSRPRFHRAARHPDYCRRFGFVPAHKYGIECEYDAPVEAFMIMELRSGALSGHTGTIKYLPEFHEVWLPGAVLGGLRREPDVKSFRTFTYFENACAATGTQPPNRRPSISCLHALRILNLNFSSAFQTKGFHFSQYFLSFYSWLSLARWICRTGSPWTRNSSRPGYACPSWIHK